MTKYSVKKLIRDFKFIEEEPFVRGTRKKILAKDSNGNVAMFKYEKKDYICSEACSEKMAYEIAKILNYECAQIELAVDGDNTLGVLNYFFSTPVSPHTDIVAYLNKNKDERKNYYTISNIKNILDEIDKELFKHFIKIMIFDALIGEQDRHEENWGITERDGKYFISPLYDNGDSLLREFKNEDTAIKYYNKTKSFDAYICRSHCIIYKEDHETQYKHFELIEELYNDYPEYVLSEINNLKNLTDDLIHKIVNYIPDDLLTNEHKEYIILYLIKRRDKLLSIVEKR